MSSKVLEELTELLTYELKDKEKASITVEAEGRKIKAIGISSRFITPYEFAKMTARNSHPDPFYAPWAEILSRLVAQYVCGPPVHYELAKDRAPLCDFESVPSWYCRYSCGPILAFNTDIGTITAPPCHGVSDARCSGKTMFPDLCTMIKAAGCRPRGANWYAYAVSVLDFSNREYTIYEVKLMVDDLPLALYSFGQSPEKKNYDEILYLYMVIAFPYDFEGVRPPPGAE
jgi:hypothetical protein